MKLYKRILLRLAVPLPDPLYLKLVYFIKMKGYLNLKKPISYNEKLNWLKIHDRKPQYKAVVDKYEAKRIASELIGEEYIIPTYGVWDNFDSIDFSKLPEEFVLKTTHDSGGVVIVRGSNKADKTIIKRKIDESLRKNYYYDFREWPYKNIKPRIIAEKVISETIPIDYKFFVFNGEIDSVMVCTDRASGHPSFRFYDKKWNRLIYMKKELEPENDLEKPENFEEMISIVKKLAEGFVHIRVDLYNEEGKIYFGELTLYNQGGFDTDITRDTDLYWGAKIDLSLVR